MEPIARDVVDLLVLVSLIGEYRVDWESEVHFYVVVQLFYYLVKGV